MINSLKLKRILSVLLVMLFFAAALWAGGGQQSRGTVSTDASLSNAGKIFSQPRTIDVLWQEHPAYPYDTNSISIQSIFEKTNAKLDMQIVPSGGAAERINILIATNELPELAFLSRGSIDSHYADGIFLEVSDYIDSMPNFKQLWNSIPELRRTGIDGKLYGFQVLHTPEPAPLAGPVMRTDLLEKHNLPVPSTYPELIDVLAKLKELYPDSKPWTNRSGVGQLFSAEAAYNMGTGWGMYFEDDLDKWVFAQATPEFKLALEVYAEAYRRGVLDPDYATNNTDSWRNKSVSGQSFFFYDNSQYSIDFTRMMQANDPSMRMELIPTLTNSRGARRTHPFGVATQYALVSWMLGLRTDIEDPDRIMQFIDWLYSEEGFILCNFGIEGVTFEYDSEGEPQYLPAWVESIRESPNIYTDITRVGGLGRHNSIGMITGENMLMISSQKASGQWDAVNENFWSLIDREVNEGIYVHPHAAPSFSVDDQQTIRELSTRVNTFLNQEYHKYITGAEPISNWDAVARQTRELGATQLEDIYNRAEAALR